MPKIFTDHKWKQFKYRYEVPRKVLEDDFDYLDEDVINGFFRYRRRWYHLSQFMRPARMAGLAGWHGYASDSFFSGVVIRLSDDGEEYQVGTYIG